MKKAFTLAEVLVTLGIIGVVAALTMPNIIDSNQKKSYITQLRKVYSELSQAAESALSDGNTPNLNETSAMRRGDFLTRYFKTTQTCNAEDITNCFANQYSNLNGESIRLRDYISQESSCAIVASGYSICIKPSGHVLIDVNSKQGPNTYGRDVFSLFIENNGTVTSNVTPEDATVGGCKSAAYGECFAKIMNDGWAMDY